MSTDDIHIKEVRDLILQNRRFTIREIAEDVGITVPRTRPQLWTNQSWVLHHDNAPAYSSSLVRNFLAKNETIIVPQPTYSPDLAPADFILFPKLKSTLKRRRFDTFDEIQKISTKDLFAIPKEAFQKVFQNWQKRSERCVASEGNYFEGDKLEKLVSINIKILLHQSHLFLINPCMVLKINKVLNYNKVSISSQLAGYCPMYR
jgi:transposase